jgi:hypothetical protein
MTRLNMRMGHGDWPTRAHAASSYFMLLETPLYCGVNT